MDLKYKVDDRPPAGELLLYGLQWFAVTLPSIIIIGNVLAGLHFSDTGEKVQYLQNLLLITGAAVLIQVLAGHRLPLVIGPASVLLVGIVATLSSGKGPIYSAIFVGGIILAIAGFTGFFAKIRKFFTTRVVVVILMLIAFALSPVIIKLIFQGPLNALGQLSFALLLCLAMFVANNLFKGVWKSTVVVCGIIGGTLLHIALTGGETVTAAVPEEWLLPLATFSFSLDFEPGVLISFFFCFLALSINDLGSIESIGGLLGAGNMESRAGRGIGFTGIVNAAAGLWGVIGSVNYSMSPGIIAATGCASRFTLVPAGIGLVILSLFPWPVAFISNLPGVVIGSILLYLMGAQLAAGLLMLTEEKALSGFNDGIVLGFPLLVAIIVSFMPQSALETIPELLRPIIENGFVMGVLCVLVLEHAVFRK